MLGSPFKLHFSQSVVRRATPLNRGRGRLAERKKALQIKSELFIKLDESISRGGIDEKTLETKRRIRPKSEKRRFTFHVLKNLIKI